MTRRDRRRTTTVRERAIPTVQLAPVEIEALLQAAEQAPDATAPTVEMIPLERPARGTDPQPAHTRGPRRPRATLRVEEIVRPKKK